MTNLMKAICGVITALMALLPITFPKNVITETTTTVEVTQAGTNLGTFKLTFYTPHDDKWGYQTATGVRSEHLKTCAVDPKVIPYGSVLQITGSNGQTLTLKAVDCGSAIKGNKIDIFWDGDTQSGYDWMAKFGTTHEVYKVN